MHRAVAMPPSEATPMPSIPSVTVLVEDSGKIREVLIPSMEELGNMQVVAIAETVDEALAAFALHAGTWQVAVVDLFLREGSGLDVLRACETRGPGQRVVVLTNYATAEIRRRCLALGANAVFDKSTELDAFFDLCASWGDA
jgi:DNA-binding NarL/FixJ family response regulator